ncbi:transposase [Micromonospora sp. ATCC 39149]|uniref:IS110 family transposase n=1 Tax=Micromonospora sp. (strain ATCC 39149 / NRRL 15099 / SCC 1413) TaxID=219305 RepID=UPI000682F066|nr:transposase [Micromonospora sp. ATCC 39149]
MLAAGFRVITVHTRFMATARRAGRQPGKSDPIDALAVAHAALREPDLPVAELDGPSRQIKLLSDHRRDLIAERTKVINRLRRHLHELDPQLHIPARGLRSYRHIDAVAARLDDMPGTVARIARELAQRAGRAPGTPKRIVAAAVTLLDEHGVEGLTMRRLAEGLDVTATAVYRHVKTKDDVLDVFQVCSPETHHKCLRPAWWSAVASCGRPNRSCREQLSGQRVTVFVGVGLRTGPTPTGCSADDVVDQLLDSVGV